MSRAALIFDSTRQMNAEVHTAMRAKPTPDNRLASEKTPVKARKSLRAEDKG